MSNPFRRVFDTLVDGYNNLQLSSGQVLQSSTRRQDSSPRLMWKLSGFNTESWQPFKYRVTWDLPAELKVQGEPGDAAPLLDALNDLYEWSDSIYGLPVDVDGNLVAIGAKQDELSARGGLFTIADRFVGPHISKVTPKLDGDSTYSSADVVFHVEFVVDNTPEVKAVARQFTVGANV